VAQSIRAMDDSNRCSQRCYNRWCHHLDCLDAVRSRNVGDSSGGLRMDYGLERTPCGEIDYALWRDAFAAASVDPSAMDALLVAWQHYRSGASAVVVLTGVRMACKLAQGEAVDALRCAVYRRIDDD